MRDLVFRLRTKAGLTQAELTLETLETLERLATAVDSELVVGVGENLSGNPGIAELEQDGHAMVRRAG